MKAEFGIWIILDSGKLFLGYPSKESRQQTIDLLDRCIADLLQEPSKRWPIRLLFGSDTSGVEKTAVIMSHKLVGYEVGTVDRLSTSEVAIRERYLPILEKLVEQQERLIDDSSHGDEWRHEE